MNNTSQVQVYILKGEIIYNKIIHIRVSLTTEKYNTKEN